MKFGTRILAAALLATGSMTVAHAGTTVDGVTFSTSYAGNVLTVEIDAAGHTGGWASATTIGALEVKDVGNFDSVLMSGPGAASGWNLVANELNANGCAGGGQGGRNACAFGRHVGLTDDMVFKFTFSGGTIDLTNPHLKVAFYNGDGTKKVGSLLSVNVAAVPEPGQYAMLLAGLGVVGLLRRRRA